MEKYMKNDIYNSFVCLHIVSILYMALRSVDSWTDLYPLL